MAGLRALLKRTVKGTAVESSALPTSSPAVSSAPATISKKKQPAAKLSVAVRTILYPLVTEKTARMGTEGKPRATFRVLRAATKSDVKRAAQELYGARVLSVQILNTPSRRLRSRFGKGRTVQGLKKAIVQFAPGSTVDVTKFPATIQ